MKSVYDPVGMFGSDTVSSVPVCSPPSLGVSNCHEPNTFTSDELFCSMEMVPKPETEEMDDAEDATDSDDVDDVDESDELDDVS